MPRPLVEDDRPDLPDAPPQNPNIFQPIAEKGESFWSMLGKLGHWLSSKRLPDPVKSGMRDFGREIWMSKDDFQRFKRAEQRARSNGEPLPRRQKFTATPFRSFGPSEKKKKRGRL